MIKITHKIVVCFFILVLLGRPAYSQSVNRIIAKVGDEVITLGDVNKALAQQKRLLTERLGPAKGVEEYRHYEKNVVDEMVMEKLLAGEIAAEKIVISPSDTDAEFKSRVRQTGLTEVEFIAKLAQAGLSLPDYKAGLKKELGKQQFVQKKIMPKIVVSDFDVKQEYQKHVNDFQTFRKLRFIEVFLTPDKFSSQEALMKMAVEIQTKLKKNQIPSALIRQYSSGAFADKGGDSGVIEVASMRPDLSRLLVQLNKGETSQMLPTGGGIFIFRMLDKTDPAPVPFNEVANALRSRLGDKFVLNELKRYLMNVKDQTFVEVHPL